MKADRSSPVKTERSGNESHTEAAAQPSQNAKTKMVLAEAPQSSSISCTILFRHGSDCWDAISKATFLKSPSTGHGIVAQDNIRMSSTLEIASRHPTTSQ